MRTVLTGSTVLQDRRELLVLPPLAGQPGPVDIGREYSRIRPLIMR